MNTKKKILSLIMCLLMAVTLMAIGAASVSAAYYTVDYIEASFDWKVGQGDEVPYYDYELFEIEEGYPFDIIAHSNAGAVWEKYNAETQEWEEYTGETFDAGKYRLNNIIVMMLDSYYASYYDLSEDLEVYVNGEKWTVQAVATHPTQGSGAVITSPEIELCAHTGGTATCSEKAVCTKCGEEYGEVAGHKGGTATCETRAKCTVCGQSYGDYTDCLMMPSTCSKKSYCKYCGYTNRYASYNYNNHANKETIKGTPATCSKSGTTDKVRCADCYRTISGGSYIAATGNHKGGIATCETRAKCSTCNAYYGSYAAHKGGKATCQSRAKCSVCGDYYGSYASHTYKKTTTKATLKKDGSIVEKCTGCSSTKSKTTIAYPKTISLSATTYSYNGKAKKPKVTVKDSKGNTLKSGTHYTVTYASGRKSIGKYTVTVKFKGNYSGTKKLSFSITPAKAKISKLTAKNDQFTATWKKVSKASGYELQYSTTSSFTKDTTKKVTIKSAKTVKKTIKKIAKGKTYYVRVRAYTTKDKKKIYGSYSDVKKFKITKKLTAREKEVAAILKKCERYAAYLGINADLIDTSISLYRMTGNVRYYGQVCEYTGDCFDYLSKIRIYTSGCDELYMLYSVSDYDYPNISPSHLAPAASMANKARRVRSIYNIICTNYNLEPVGQD